MEGFLLFGLFSDVSRLVLTMLAIPLDGLPTTCCVEFSDDLIAISIVLGHLLFSHILTIVE